jgi:hypothetical protein
MSIPKERCPDCNEMAVTIVTRPKRYDDGKRRCRPCMTARVDGIRAYWQEAMKGYAANYNNTGGRGRYGTDVQEVTA